MLNLYALLIIFRSSIEFSKKRCIYRKSFERDKFIKGKNKNENVLTNIVNKKFNTDFSVLQRKCRVNKILQEIFCCADEDAYQFVQAVTEKTKKEGYFCTKLDKYKIFLISRLIILGVTNNF